MLAFRELPADVREHMMPLFDVAAPTKSTDKAKAEKYVLNNIVRAEKAAKGLQAVFVDSSELDPNFRLPDGSHPLLAAALALTKAGVRPIPVIGLHRDLEHQKAAKAIMQMMGPWVCIRLDATDVSTARMSHARIKELLSAIGNASTEAFLLMDLQGLYGMDVTTAAAPVIRLLGLLQESKWAGIIIGGYGVPEQLSTAVQPKSQDYLPRIEQKIFLHVREHAAGLPLWFADYTMIPPSVFELDWRLISKVIAPKALYALDDSWLVVRGGAFLSHPKGYAQYYDIAGEIVALEEFSGGDFSPGDQYIADRVNGTDKPGSPASWITACVSHHMALTARYHAT